MQSGAVIVAAGRGLRMGGIDKCALPLLGRTILSYSVAACAAAVSTVVVVVAPDRVEAWQRIALDEHWPQIHGIIPGGETRQASVEIGVAELGKIDTVDLIAIHDGARPLITPGLVHAGLEAARTDGAAILAVPVTDTIKRVQDGRVIATLDRTTLWSAQTPQTFRAALLRDAFAWARSTGADPFTDEAGLVERFGAPVSVVRGDRTNIKVTEPDDRTIATALLAARHGYPHA
jgi:2-C-methyl-D-erythritol 4-phosphate cytidylyltransferase